MTYVERTVGLVYNQFRPGEYTVSVRAIPGDGGTRHPGHVTMINDHQGQMNWGSKADMRLAEVGLTPAEITPDICQAALFMGIEVLFPE